MQKNNSHCLKWLRGISKFACAFMVFAAMTMAGYAQDVAQTLYIDFGANDSGNRGMLTTGADANGHYWSNVHSVGVDDANKYIFPGTVFDLVNDADQPTGYQLLVNVRLSTNGKSGGGGLLAPSADLLGDLAVASATEDYAFPEAHQDYVYVTFRHLDKTKAYRFSAFGSRTSTSDRTATFVVQGENGWQGDHQMSGAGLGTDGTNANNSTICVSDAVFPDRDGNITFTIVKHDKGGYVHLNAMKVEELSGLTRPNVSLSQVQKFLIDFGENNSSTRGSKTEGADGNGNYWNNVFCQSGNVIAEGSEYALVNSGNQAAGVTAVVGGGLKTNGKSGGGGFTTPSADWLGELAVSSATEDYMFIEGSTGSTQVAFSGLNPNHCYKFYVFGSRNTGTDRDYYITVSGQRDWQSLHITSGSSIGGQGVNGNTMNVSVSDYIYPDKDGNILFTMTMNHSMAHINLMKIEEYAGGLRPGDPLALKNLSISGSAVENGSAPFAELRPQGLSTGLYETYVELQPGTYTLTGETTDGIAVMLGRGEGNSLSADGAAIAVAEKCVARVKFDAKDLTYSVTPVELVLKGEVVPDGTKLAYEGDGVWHSTVTLDKNTTKLFVDRVFYFTLNGSDALAIKRIPGSTNQLGMASEGYAVENLRQNGGTFDITVDLRNRTFGFSAPIDENRISVFGSSVSNGQGASSNHGYAYMYGQNLQKRYDEGTGTAPFYVSSVAINGNSTPSLLGRYDDLTRDFGRYVVFGLSLGNEGIHGAGNQQAVFNQFRDNMLSLIAQVEAEGKVAVVMNNYTRTDFVASDYDYIKQMNLLIHEWEVPSVNLLGAIDDGAGHWATGFQNPGDIYHPTTEGHREFYYAMVPSLFDALAAGKSRPERREGQSLTLKDKRVITFKGEETVHPFALSLRVKGHAAGRVASFSTANGTGAISVDGDGNLTYTSPEGKTVSGASGLTDGGWHYVTLSHYWAQRRSLLYVDDVCLGEVSDRMEPTVFVVGDNTDGVERSFGELTFWRSALNGEEVSAHVSGRMLQSSLDIYAPLSADAATIENLAQSMNTVSISPLNPEEPVTDGIRLAECMENQTQLAYDTLGGRAVKHTRGVWIQDGKKFVRK